MTKNGVRGYIKKTQLNHNRIHNHRNYINLWTIRTIRHI